MTGELERLAERVESATGADRELDEAVEIAVRGGEAVYGMTRYTGEPTVGIRRPNAAYRTGFATEPCYPLTASLDAALALVSDKLPGNNSTLVVLDAALRRLSNGIGNGRLVAADVTADRIARYALAALLRTLSAQPQPSEANRDH